MFERTSQEREDAVKPIRNDHSAEQEDRVQALTEKVKREYLDSGLYYKEMHSAQGGSVND